MLFTELSKLLAMRKNKLDDAGLAANLTDERHMRHSESNLVGYWQALRNCKVTFLLDSD